MKNNEVLERLWSDYKSLYEAACVYDATSDEFKSLMNQAIKVGEIIADLENQKSKEKTEQAKMAVDLEIQKSKEQIEQAKLDAEVQEEWWMKLIPDGNAVVKGLFCVVIVGAYIYCDKNGLLVPKATNFVAGKLI